MTRKVCAVITARPTYSRVKTALAAIEDHPSLQLQLVVAASALLDRYGAVVDQVRDDGFVPAAQVQMVLEGENPTSMAKTTGIGVIELATVVDNLRPDVVMTVADRYETLATAIAASYMGTPLAHVQGGEVSGSIDERVRHAVTKLSDVHFAATECAADRIVRMGEHPRSVFVTGCPSIDLAADVAATPGLNFDPFERYQGVGSIFDVDGGYVVVVQHPVTNEHEVARAQVLETLAAVEQAGLPAFWFWPNVDAGSDGTSRGIRSFREISDPQAMHFFKNMAPVDFLRLAANARCLIGNSSVGIRECSFLGVPVVNIGSRQDGRERGPNVVDVGYEREQITQAIREQSSGQRPRPSTIYGDGKAGVRIAELLAEIPLSIEKRLAY